MNSNELIVKENELIINENTKLNTIKNKQNYTKLTIYKKIRPIFLNNFKNIKELIIDGTRYNEERIDKLSFKETLEKLVINGIKILGIKDDSSGWGTIKYNLPTPNLKVLELPNVIKNINPNYIKDLNKLETIIFNVSNITKLDLNKDSSYKPLLVPSSLKNIIIKTEFNSYNINLDYIPKYISQVYFYSSGITLEFNNDFINTHVKIDNNIVNVTNTLTSINDELVNNKCLYIPDYIDNIKIENKTALKEIDSISINPKKLKLNDMIDSRRLDEYLNNISKIIIRDNNEMNLYPNKEFTTNEFGNLRMIYIIDKKLHISFDKILILIDKDSIISKESRNIKELNKYKGKELNKFPSMKRNNEETEKHIESSEEVGVINCEQNGSRPYEEGNNDTNLNIYSSYQLEYYTYYKKLLELLTSDNKELNNAMNIVERELVKKLKINE